MKFAVPFIESSAVYSAALTSSLSLPHVPGLHCAHALCAPLHHQQQQTTILL